MIDDEQVTITAGSPTSDTSFDEIGLRPCGVRNRITILAAGASVAFVAVIHERDRDARLAAAHSYIWNAVRRRTEVRMRSTRASNEIDVGVRLWIDRRRRNVLVPPVVRRKQLPAA